MPKLGNDKSTKPEVEEFYNFWYAFDSWRTFEYLDEDVPDDNESRDQRRHVERKNANARKKKKADDNARLRELVDTALDLDERIKKFKQAEFAEKNKKRFAKEAEAKRAAEEAAKKKEEEAKAAAEKAEAEKAAKLDGKKAKEAAKNAVKKNKRVIRAAVKDNNYFASGVAPASQIEAVLNDTDVILAATGPDELATLTAKLNGLKVADEIKAVLVDEVKSLKGAGKIKDGEIKALD